MVGWFRLPGDTSTFHPVTTNTWPGSGAQTWAREGLAGRRRVSQHVVQKHTRKASKDVHGAEDEEGTIIQTNRKRELIQTAVEGSNSETLHALYR